MIKFEELLEGIFDPGTEEYDTIEECYKLITGTAATTSAEAKTHMILLDHCRTKMSTIYFLLSRQISRLQNPFQETYDSQYTRFVKQGLPSKDAIMAKIRATSPEYAGMCKRVEALEQVRDLVSSYMRCIDNTKQTTIECLRDSRRLD